MKVTIGTTTFEITKYKPFRDKLQGVYIKMWIPEESISFDDLRALLKNNAEDIVITDAAGNTTVLSGYRTLGPVIVAGGEYVVDQFCDSELAHLLNEARKQIEKLEREKADLQNEVVAQGNELFAQAETIVLQGETIATQNEQVAALVEASTSQLDAIDSIMTEILPMVAQEAATIAVAQALAAIEEGETEEPENDIPVVETETTNEE